MVSTPRVLLRLCQEGPSPPHAEAVPAPHPAYSTGEWRYLTRLEATGLALLLCTALLSTGCVTLTPRPGGGGSEGPRARSSLRATGASTPSVEGPAPLASTEAAEPKPRVSGEPGEQERLHRGRSARGLGPDAALARTQEAPASEVDSAPAPEGPPSCGGEAVPPGWPDSSSGDSEALLAPFLTCTSPGEVLALQERVDIPRLVDALDDWRAVRLGALGPPREDVARLLNEKRTALLLKAPRAYGSLNAQVLSVFIVDSAYDDDLREILFLLAQEKRLEETLGLLPAFRAALEKRGLKPTARVEPDSRLGQAARGLRQLGEDVLSSSPVAEGGPGDGLRGRQGEAAEGRRAVASDPAPLPPGLRQAPR